MAIQDLVFRDGLSTIIHSIISNEPLIEFNVFFSSDILLQHNVIMVNSVI